jgi:ferrous iron transport protein B
MKLYKSCGNNCSSNCCGSARQISPENADHEFTVALAGQPNTGKSTIFNMLTGANQHVGNWPGKTVEKKHGFFICNDRVGKITDLPGTYSLTANSLEERITRDFLINGHADVTVVVVDASQLERSFYMVAETLLLPGRVIIALNMVDVAEKMGKSVDAEALEHAMNVPVVPLVAAKGKGIDRLIETVDRIVKESQPPQHRGPVLEEAFGVPFQQIKATIHGMVPAPYTEDWITLKLIEKDSNVIEIMEKILKNEDWEAIKSQVTKNEDAVLKGSTARYDWINEIVSKAVAATGKNFTSFQQTRFDSVATHPVWGKIIAFGVLVLTVLTTYIVCLPPMLLGLGLLLLPIPLRNALSGHAPDWLLSLLCDGLLTGLGVATCVIAFIAGVFLVLGFLEDVGYLARLAFVFDRFMNKLGLHGKSFIPLTMGFACNIMAVSGTRVIDGWRQRLITLLLAPLIPCKGLLVVVSFISLVFFGVKTVFVFFALFAVMACHLVFTATLLRKFVIKGNDYGMLMELPPYHTPNLKTIRTYTLSRVKAFFHHGFGLIVFAAFLTWVGVYFPDGQIDTSYLARFGRVMEPFGQLMGMDWRLLITFLVAFSSKEATLGAMAVIYGATSSSRTAIEGLYMDQDLILNIKSHFGDFLATTGISDASALAFVFAIFFSLPCFGTLAVMYGETRSLKWTFGALAYYFSTSVIMGAIAYRVGLVIF